jgi:hypothetical protein
MPRNHLDRQPFGLLLFGVAAIGLVLLITQRGE